MSTIKFAEQMLIRGDIKISTSSSVSTSSSDSSGGEPQTQSTTYGDGPSLEWEDKTPRRSEHE